MCRCTRSRRCYGLPAQSPSRWREQGRCSKRCSSSTCRRTSPGTVGSSLRPSSSSARAQSCAGPRRGPTAHWCWSASGGRARSGPVAAAAATCSGSSAWPPGRADEGAHCRRPELGRRGAAWAPTSAPPGQAARAGRAAPPRAPWSLGPPEGPALFWTAPRPLQGPHAVWRPAPSHLARTSAGLACAELPGLAGAGFLQRRSVCE
mmetsp:Transcript_2879/g.8926  ORF Transcript_2879/g.8926 Transcript_2879/m.8926 type:complete len:205 (-) Transcript_2879:34-648(-)